MIEIAPSQVYTIRDVAEYLKCSTRKIHRLIASGYLKGFKIGNQRRFKGEEILQFIERQGADDGFAEPVVAPAVQAERLYSLREVAAILHVTSADVAHLLRAGKLAGFRVGMDWRCWGRDLIRLAGSDDEPVAPDGAPPYPAQPPLMPADAPAGDGDPADTPIEKAA